MKEIKKKEKITDVYGAWKPSDVAFIKSLEWSAGHLLLSVYCQLRGKTGAWPDMSRDFFEVLIRFNNISTLKLDFAKRLHQVMGFDILDISERGLEKMNFQIEDYEGGSIDFFCEEIEILEVLKPVPIVFN